jgi:cysteinyl-tRNA synthetase
MVVRLGDLARTGARDPRQVLGGFVDALLAERAAARSERRYGDADRVRDALIANGVEVRDTAEGTQWDLRSDAG